MAPWNEPAPHRAQAVAPALLWYWPAKQASHCALPVEAAAVPGEQRWQLDAAEPEKVPAAQLTQLARSRLLAYLPGRQASHDDAFAPEKRPSAQCLHAAWPLAGWNWPAPQFSQPVAPAEG